MLTQDWTPLLQMPHVLGQFWAMNDLVWVSWQEEAQVGQREFLSTQPVLAVVVVVVVAEQKPQYLLHWLVIQVRAEVQ
jgi:hypothetical protein